MVADKEKASNDELLHTDLYGCPADDTSTK